MEAAVLRHGTRSARIVCGTGTTPGRRPPGFRGLPLPTEVRPPPLPFPPSGRPAASSARPRSGPSQLPLAWPGDRRALVRPEREFRKEDAADRQGPRHSNPPAASRAASFSWLLLHGDGDTSERIDDTRTRSRFVAGTAAVDRSPPPGAARRSAVFQKPRQPPHGRPARATDAGELGRIGMPLFGTRLMRRGMVGSDISVLQFLLARRGVAARGIDSVFRSARSGPIPDASRPAQACTSTASPARHAHRAHTQRRAVGPRVPSAGGPR